MNDAGALSASITIGSKNKGRTTAGEYSLFLKAFPLTNGTDVGSHFVDHATHVMENVAPKWPVKVNIAAGEGNVQTLLAHLSSDDIGRIDFGDRIVWGVSICAVYKMPSIRSTFITGTVIMLEYKGDGDRVRGGVPGPLDFDDIVMTPYLGLDVRT